jgi:hypothetical protein
MGLERTVPGDLTWEAWMLAGQRTVAVLQR